MAHETHVTRANGSQAHEIAAVLIRVPADRGYVVLVRSAAGHLGAQLGYSVPEIMDLRLAVDEACGLFLGARTPHRGLGAKADLDCRFSVTDHGLRFKVSGSAAGVTEPDTGGLGWQVLSALVDAISWGNDGTTASVALEKRHEPGWPGDAGWPGDPGWPGDVGWPG
jgi:serine/threonine-protein kinase RsbW